ncbi:hypothetical protein GGS23DRAFT_497360 [Durotheca rogersii]|uniref:uncharacterized protein n=1 Tax=Durotheca rogersii TaxID=419775 RepID=UPI002220F951|nr:uncharacterized protein GGS23DRAFT_497360 [Durotheca rogersii]KAI5864390.1 hypothetical protein GGS23DRAFT_497360 [Durotheca rogersii]
MINLEHSSPPGTPGAAPLQPMSSDRVNQQRDSPMVSPIRTEHLRDSDVHDKIRQFNNLAHTNPAHGASMSRQLERKTADAALKRAMLGREEAEGEMRRYRDEARALRKQVEESRGRERKVGERLEDVMEKYGQAKETLSHSKTIWEKEIRQARKEVFRTQSSIVKLQEELKAARNAYKSVEECLARERDLSKAREQEAFASRHQLAEVHDQLEKSLERIEFVEQERDAYKAAAQSEEIARVAAEGRLPLPPEEPNSEFASPKKGARVSLSTADISSSAASEAEIEELTRLWQWEKQRADRAQDHLEFVQAECQLRCCPRARARPRRSLQTPGRHERQKSVPIVDAADLVILGQEPRSSVKPASEETKPQPEPQPQFRPEPPREEREPSQPKRMESPTEHIPQRERSKEPKEPRRGTIFLPAEGIFRTISQEDLQEAAAGGKSEEVAVPSELPTPVDPPSPGEDVQPRRAVMAPPPPMHYSRTPSVDPPTFALLARERTSLLSLLNAPHQGDAPFALLNDIPTIPTTPSDPPSSRDGPPAEPEADDEENHRTTVLHHHNHNHNHNLHRQHDVPRPDTAATAPSADAETRRRRQQHPHAPPSRAQTSAAFYAVTTTTTTVPVRDSGASNTSNTSGGGSRTPSFDVNNPAMTPTMTREQALAQIKERRGRARSAAQQHPGGHGSSGSGSTATTPKRHGSGTGERRDVSAPAGRAAKARPS